MNVTIKELHDILKYRFVFDITIILYYSFW